MTDHHLGGSSLDQPDEFTWMPDVWERLIADYGITSVLDLGCGPGFATEWYEKRGLSVLGIEGDPSAIAARRTARVVQHDMTLAPCDPGIEFDMCWCAEFVEHVEAQFAPNFLAAMKRCKFVCMTFATPGQGGYHHVNEQPEAYWLKQLASVGFENVPEETARLRATSKGEAWGRRTLTFFRRVEGTPRIIPTPTPAIHVVSTGWLAPTKDKCLKSVALQQGVTVEHHYIEASDQTPSLSCMQNTIDVIAALPDNAIVALLDGDDWLAHTHALEAVQWVYDSEPSVLVTYGSYVQSDGRPGYCAPYKARENVRTSQFRASHLKTFRAWLFKRIDPDDLMLPHARDHQQMIPLIEMAGAERVRFIPECLYVYNLATSFEFNATRAELLRERQCVEAMKRRPEYQVLP